MKHHQLFHFLFFLLSALVLINGCHDQEREALLTFKASLSDPSNRLASWQGQNCCNWRGIRCSDSLNIISLNLRNPNPNKAFLNLNSKIISTSNSTYNALKGKLSPFLFTLSHITYLDLSFNNFMLSKIPSGLSNLTKLTHLNLANSFFSDSITTQFSNLTSLTNLDLSCSYKVSDLSSISYNLTSKRIYSGSSLFTYINNGYISSASLNWLSGLNNLRELRLDGLDLSEASKLIGWAEPISRLSDLRLIQLSDCGITGKIPIKEFLNLTHLSTLEMDKNLFISTIPSQFANLTALLTLDLTQSNLHGSVPYLPQLQTLFVGDNPKITIDLSSMFRVPWNNLENLGIQSTQVNGSIQTLFENTPSLIYFYADSCSIVGSLPSSLYNHSKLEYLFLGYNYISGSLSPLISNLQNLRYLHMIENVLEGPIPESICEISSLEYLHLSANSLRGNVPDCISLLTNLKVFMVSDNPLNGTIPSFISLFQNSNPNTISLGSSGLTVKIGRNAFPENFQPTFLDLSSCNIGGDIPFFISNLTQLEFLNLAGNRLSGTIPSWLFNLPKLGYLDLSFNDLHGIVPPSIELQSFFGHTMISLAGNRLEGPIPILPKTIEALDLSKNVFTGYIPTQVGELQNIRHLSFSGNKLFGPIPISFCHDNNVLMHLDLSNNSLSGMVPTSVENCTSLISLNLAWNNLSGKIPDELKGAKNMTYLQLNGNHFDGPFPTFIREFQNLEVLNLGNNSFEGEIPRFIGNLQKLRILVLELNHFTGSIPTELTNLGNLQFIGFSKNNLSGAIPGELNSLKELKSRPARTIIGLLISLVYSGVELRLVTKGWSYELDVVFTDLTGIDVSCNSLTGKIPQDIGLLQGLYMLNLSHNNLLGEIPMSMGKMVLLESLDLSFNNLSGEIPITLTTLDYLSFLNLSYNNLSGTIPKGMHFDTLFGDGSGYVGNNFLCGAPNGPNCEESNSSETCVVEDENQNVLFYLVVLIGYGVGLWGLFLILYLMGENWRDQYWRMIDRIVLKITKCM